MLTYAGALAFILQFELTGLPLVVAKWLDSSPWSCSQGFVGGAKAIRLQILSSEQYSNAADKILYITHPFISLKFLKVSRKLSIVYILWIWEMFHKQNSLFQNLNTYATLLPYN